MPTYTIRDPHTGKSLRVTGDSPPTEAELNEIFASQRPTPAAAPPAKPAGPMSWAEAKAAYDGDTIAAAERDVAAQQEGGRRLVETMAGGPIRAVRGAGEMARGNYAKGATDVLTGGLQTAATLAAPAGVGALIAKPGLTLARAAGGAVGATAGAVGGKALAEHAGATEDQAALASTVGGIVGGGAGASLARRALDAVPSLERAGAAFQDVMAAARQKPVDISAPGAVALRISELAERGAAMPQVARKFLQRITDPNKGALTYEEARDFYSAISRLSATEAQRITPAVRGQLNALRGTLNESLERTAQSVGKLPEYQSAMREYAQRARLNEAAKATGRNVAKYAIPAGAVGLGAKAAMDIAGK